MSKRYLSKQQIDEMLLANENDSDFSSDESEYDSDHEINSDSQSDEDDENNESESESNETDVFNDFVWSPDDFTRRSQQSFKGTAGLHDTALLYWWHWTKLKELLLMKFS